MSSRSTHPIHVMQIVGDPIGGIRKHVHSIINGLNAEHFIQSYAYSTTAQDENFRQEIGPLRKQLFSDIPLRIRKRPHPSDFFNLLRLIYFVKKNRVDVVHGHGAKGGMYARMIGIFCRVPAIYTPHGGVAHRMFGYWEDKLYSLVEKFLMKFTYCFIFESRYTAESFQSKVGKIDRPWLVNYSGIECPPLVSLLKFKKTNALDVFDIGVFAMLRKEKGQRHLINAIASVINSGIVNVRLHIFGNGPDRELLEERVQTLGLKEYIFFHGDVAQAEPEMAKMDIIVIPSLFESFGYVGLEALALGKPVIASAVGGLLEIFDDKIAQLVPPGDEAALCNAIIQCTQTKLSPEEVAQRGQDYCKAQFSLQNMMAVLSNQYQRAAKNY